MPFYQIEGEEAEEENLNDADSESEEEEVEEEPTSGKELKSTVYNKIYISDIFG